MLYLSKPYPVLTLGTLHVLGEPCTALGNHPLFYGTVPCCNSGSPAMLLETMLYLVEPYPDVNWGTLTGPRVPSFVPENPAMFWGNLLYRREPDSVLAWRA